MEDKSQRIFQWAVFALVASFTVLCLMLLYICFTAIQTGAMLAVEVQELRVRQIIMQAQVKQALEESKQFREQSPSRAFTRTRTETFNVSAYTLHPDECGKPVGSAGYGTTASGRKISNADAYRVVAVDNDKIKFGTRMILHAPAGPIHVVAADTGGAIEGNRLDLFVGENNQADALAWGVKRMKVTVLE